MKTILSLIVLFMVVNLNAQTRLMDLSVLPVNQINDTIEMLVKFKVKNINEVQSIQLFFETQPQLADIVQKSVTISQQGNIYFVTLDGKTTPATQSPKIQTPAVLNQPACYNQSNGSIIVNVAGGTPPYSYNWSGPNAPYPNSNQINNLQPGIYWLTVTDASGCSTISHYQLNEPSQLVLSVNAPSQLCSNATAPINAIVSGGTPPYSYNWNGPNPPYPNSNQINASPGNYQLTVTDANGCIVVSQPKVIQNNPIPSPQFDLLGNCFYKDGQIEFINNSQHATSYLWDFGDGTTSTQQNPVHIFTDYGYYCITLTAYNECGAVSYSKSIFVEPSSCVCNFNYTKPNGAIIASGTTEYWNDEIVYGDIIIESNARLVVNTYRTIRLAPSSRIIVKEKGILELETGAKLTLLSDEICSYMWQGVEVWGVPTLWSTNTQQGKIILRNRAVIEHAHIAVLLGARKDYCSTIATNPASEQNFDLTRAGGVIQAQGAYFKMNGIDVKFLSKNSNQNDATNNIIKNNNFLCNVNLQDLRYNMQSPNRYPNIRYPWAWGANYNQRSCIGIQFGNLQRVGLASRFSGNVFDNHEFGIYTTNTRIVYVKNCQFNNMRYGMYITNTTQTLMNNFDITQCTFTNIPGNTQGSLGPYDGTGIYIKGGNVYNIHDNFRFENQNLSGTGIRTNNASLVYISNNKFNTLKTGIDIINSGSYASYIYATPYNADPTIHYQGNIFIDCEKGITTQQNNSSLCIRCNKFVLPNSNYNILNMTGAILANQGFTGYDNITDDVEKSRYGSGNLFRFDNNYPYSRKIRNEQNNPAFIYYYHTNTTQAGWTPIPEPEGPINIMDIQATMFLNPVSCPFPSSIVPQTSSTQLLAQPNIIFQKTDSLQQILTDEKMQYEQLVQNADKGNTQLLLNAITTNPPSGQLKNMLIANSPLSDTVLIALNTYFPLSPGNYNQVMEENLPVSKRVFPSFYQRVLSLPAGIRNQLLAKQANNPGKTTIGSVEQQVEQAQKIKSMYVSDVLTKLTDTTINRLDLAIVLLEQEQTPEANLILASTYLTDSNYVDAAEKIAMLPDNIEEYARWKMYATMLLNHFEQGKTIEELDSNQIATLRNFAVYCPEDITAIHAQSVLFYLLHETVPPCPEPQIRKQALPVVSYENMGWYLGKNYPNPFTRRTTIPYQLADVMKNAELVVKDASGKILQVIPLDNSIDYIEIDTHSWAAGVYVYSLRVEGKEIEQHHMIKQE